MEPENTAERFDTAAAAIGLMVGIGGMFFPRLLLRAYGADPDQLNGTGMFGWRLFAIRNIFVAGAALAGNKQARDTVFVLQGPDLLLFAHCYRTRSIPRITSALAMVSAGLVATLGLLARAGR